MAALIVISVARAARAEDAPPDSLDGPPFTTCHTWAIMDPANGEILWGLEADTPRKSASTTKMMCAYVVLTLAEEHPEVLDEVVTFTELADGTEGSTADINAGESLPVRECLYGLMLPSGNDAGNALAEHFNDRFEPPDYPAERTNPSLPDEFPTRANFIAEMNRAAERLGMTNTFYRSSFGDGGEEDDRTTTAHDLLILARAGLQNERFAEYVSTPHYATTVTTPDGGTRAVEWTNTNRLLKIEGFDGVKTGTTDQAGTCLVSSGHRGDDHLLICVLGAVTDEARYVDSRNLYRWAWLQRGHH
jgi:D-alanyl-D-alanine carboxypeptidase (penicillin-binding protein 5/6)